MNRVIGSRKGEGEKGMDVEWRGEALKGKKGKKGLEEDK